MMMLIQCDEVCIYNMFVFETITSFTSFLLHHHQRTCLLCLFNDQYNIYVTPFFSSLWAQAVCAAGMFELQIRHFQNPHGFLQTGDCCDLQATGGQHCSPRDQCDTFFQACLKEYQARVAPTGACTFGSGSTGILGGNSQSLRHRGHDGGGGGGEDGSSGHIVIPFKYAWPVSTGVVLVISMVTKGTG